MLAVGMEDARAERAIDVQGRDEGVLHTVLARVIHVVLQDDGSWLLGCAFTNPLSEDDLQALL